LLQTEIRFSILRPLFLNLKMKLRSFRAEDIPDISKIWEDHHSELYSLPNRDTAIIDAVVENGKGKLVGYGQVKLFAEAMLFLDKSAPLRERIIALKLLMLEAFRGTEQAKLQELYAFVNDPDFALLLQRHFRFYPADKAGELLIKEF
jgi:hypothetical protein